MSEQGRKFDGGKLRYDLVPVLAFEDQVKGLTYGTIKYDDNNWRNVPEGRKRYMAAAMRHLQEYRKGNLWDDEQGIHHLSAAINNFSFIVEKDLQGWEDVSEECVSEGVFKTEEDFFRRGKVIAKEFDKKDACEGVQEAVENIGEEKPQQCESCDEGWMPWPMSASKAGSPCHMCKAGEEWVKWEGGTMNVISHILVDIRFRDGTELLSTLAGIWDWGWTTGRADSEIIAYKVSK